MNGEQLKKIVEKHAIKQCESEYESSFHIFDFDAIAKEISKPLTMEELIEMLSLSCPIPIDLCEGHRKSNDGVKLSKDFCNVWNPLDLQRLLDLINKQKEQS